MADSADQDVTLFDAPNLTTPAKKPRAKKPPREVARTATGHSAQDILADWIAMCEKRTGTQVPPTVAARMGKAIRALIATNYGTNQIKYGLAIWTIRWMEYPYLSPGTLEQITWKYALDTSPEGQRFQTEMKAAVSKFMGHSAAVTGGASAQQRRDTENAASAQTWRDRYAERKQRGGAPR